MWQKKIKNTFFDQLDDCFYHLNNPSTVSQPKMIAWNDDLAVLLGLNFNVIKDGPKLENYFSGNNQIPHSQPISVAYAGHQFGHFNPSLGDGRAHLLCEVESKEDGLLYDIQLKGSGVSRYSRSGDGRSPLGPCLLYTSPSPRDRG